VGDQAETTVILLKGFIVQHISEPPQARRASSDTVAHRHRKSMATGFAFHTRTSHSPSLNPFAQVNKFEDLLQRESQLLHKYDEQAAHPESFQRISNLSGIGTQVKWQSYLYKNVLTEFTNCY
jgi:hypothetical protein